MTNVSHHIETSTFVVNGLYLVGVVGNWPTWDRFESRTKSSKEQNLKNFEF